MMTVTLQAGTLVHHPNHMMSLRPDYTPSQKNTAASFNCPGFIHATHISTANTEVLSANVGHWHPYSSGSQIEFDCDDSDAVSVMSIVLPLYITVSSSACVLICYTAFLPEVCTRCVCAQI